MHSEHTAPTMMLSSLHLLSQTGFLDPNKRSSDMLHRSNAGKRSVPARADREQEGRNRGRVQSIFLLKIDFIKHF